MCEGCRSHIGWRFIGGKDLYPLAFWALIRKSLKSKKIVKHDNELLSNECN
jgi:hypothetical protein